MPDVGSDFISSPVNLPINYAAQDWQIEQNQAHKFDQYTNPFLLAKSFNDVELPQRQMADQEAQAQAQNILQNKQYQLQQTAQSTMLPLQAQALTTQTDYTKAMGQMAGLQFSQAQQGAQQLAGYSNYLAQGDQTDPTLVSKANMLFPAAAATQPGMQAAQSVRAYNQQQAGILQQSTSNINTQQGGAMAMQAPAGVMAEDWWPKNNPPPVQSDYATPALFHAATLAYNDKSTGFYGDFVKAQMQKAQGAIKIAVAAQNQGGRAAAAAINDLKPFYANGSLSYETLAAQVGPIMAGQMMSQIGTPPPEDSNAPGTPGTGQPGQPPMVAPEVAKQNMVNAAKIRADATASPEEKLWADMQMNANGYSQYQMPLYDPAGADEIAMDQADVTNRLQALKSASHDVSTIGKMMGHQSDYDVQMGNLRDAQAALQSARSRYRINPGTSVPAVGSTPGTVAPSTTPYGAQNVNTTTPQSPASNGAAPAGAPAQGGFGTGFGNDFMGQPDYSPVMAPNRGAPAAVPETGTTPASAAPTQNTTTTQPTQGTGEATMEQLKQVANSIGVKDVRYMAANDQKQLAYAALNPTSKATPGILFKLKNTYGNRGM